MMCPNCNGEGVLEGITKTSGVQKASEVYFRCDWCEGTGEVYYTE